MWLAFALQACSFNHSDISHARGGFHQGGILDAVLDLCQDRLMAKVTGKLQITLPKALAEQCGIRVGDELQLRPVGQSIQIDRRTHDDASQRRLDRLAHFDRATRRQRTRERAVPRVPARSRGWTREDLYVRGRTR
jgi:bifunctional DNA-binding transcriptional regulator/antitoxin component of YhaV-PrlF toxin-antitoxin module